MTTPPTPTLEQEADAICDRLAEWERGKFSRLEFRNLLLTFATRQREEAANEGRHTTAQRCAEIALLADGGADPVGQGQRIATAIRAEFRLTEGS